MIVQLPDDVGTHYWPVYNVASNMDNNKRTTRYTWIGLATELSYELRVRRIDSGFDNIDYIFIL